MINFMTVKINNCRSSIKMSKVIGLVNLNYGSMTDTIDHEITRSV